MRARSDRSILCLCTLVLGCGPGSVNDGGETSTSTSTSSSTSTDTETDTGTTDETGEDCVEPVYEGDLVIMDPSQIAAYDCVVEIVGNLSISGIDAADFAGFPRLERVTETLSIAATTTLISISGFPELREVGELYFGSHVSLESIGGFAKLETIEGDLSLVVMSNLVDIDGLAGITNIGGGLALEGLPALGSIAALNVESIGGSLRIRDCDALVDLAGLENLDVLPPTAIRENAGLLSLAGLDQATQAASLVVEHNPALLDFGMLANLEVVTGDLRILGNTQLDDLAGLAGIIEIGGNLELIENDALLDLNDLGVFPTTVGGHVQICENASLVALPDSMVMSTATGASVVRNASLPNASALAFVTALGHPNGKVGGNEDLGDYPLDPCPFVDDDVCDEPVKIDGDVFYMCELGLGWTCCEFGGPTGLCMNGSDESDCPVGGGP